MRSAARLNLVLAGTALSLVTALPSPALAQGLPGPGDRVLPRALQGVAALRALGPDLERVAARNQLSASRLRQILSQDPEAGIDPDGQMFYTEAEPALGLPGGTSTPPPAYPTSQTFALHSKPGAARTLFLDLDGATVENTAWNSRSGAISSGSHIGWDSDGDPSTFSTTEHGWIQEVWRQVSETYAPFDVDVTTQDAGSAAWIRSSSSDTAYGAHVVITSSAKTKQEACGSCLGVAYVGIFQRIDPSGYYQPAWVFADDPKMDPMIVAQAASHETGHQLGLKHDGTTNASYYGGTAAWGPLMGSSRTRAVSQFSQGEYASANNQEDDLAIMQTAGLPLRSDDHGSTVVTAARLGQQTAYDVRGVIGTRSDKDVFQVELPCTTDVTVTAAGIGRQTALDLSLEVLDASGAVLASSSPTSTQSGSPPTSQGMDAQVVLRGLSGVVYLRVDGVGSGDPAGSGWSDYGSLGQYHLTATGCSNASGPAGGPREGSGTASGGSSSGGTSSPPPASHHPAATRPSAPVIRVASSGRRGGTKTAIARWSSPDRTGGAPITKYRVRAERRNRSGRVTRVYTSPYLGATVRSVELRLPRGKYTFSVSAQNRVGSSGWSQASRTVRSR